jgi:hypothetical protein
MPPSLHVRQETRRAEPLTPERVERGQWQFLNLGPAASWPMCSASAGRAAKARLDAQEARMNSSVPADFDVTQYEHRV